MLLGYSWIIAGWILIALSLIKPEFLITHALHAITIGALGTLTFTVMARSRSHRVLRDPNAKPWLYCFPLLISISTLLRLTAIQSDYSSSLMLATVCWIIAYFAFFIWYILLRAIENKTNRLRNRAA